MSLVDDTVLTIHIRGDAAGLTPALAEAKAGITGLGVETDALAVRGANAGNALTGLSGQTRSLGGEADKAAQESGKLERAVGRVGAAVSQASGAGGLGSMLKTLTGLSPETLGYIAPVLALGGGLIVAAKSASNFDDVITTLANNTGMSTRQMEQLRQEVLTLGSDSSLSLTDIAGGFEKAANAGFHGAAAYTIVEQAMHAAVETGSDLASTVDATTGILKQFSLPAADAGKALGILMTAAAQGDVRLPDLVTNFSKVGTLAGAMNMSLSQTAAAFSTLTRFTHSASTAQTDLAGALQHILTPTKTTTTLIDQLSKTSGVDLVKAFHDVSTGAISLTTFLGDVRKATDGNKSAQDALFGGMRGGLAGVILLNQGWKDYNDTAGKTANATGLVGQQWQRTSQLLSTQMGVLRNQVHELFISVGTDFLPSLTAVVHEMVPVAQGIGKFTAENPGATKTFLELAGGALAVSLGTKAVVSVWSGLAAGISGGVRAVQIAGQFMTDLGNGAASTAPELNAAGTAAEVSGAEAEAGSAGWVMLSGAMKAAAGIGIIYAGIEVANSIKESGNEKAIRDTAQAYAEGKISADKYNTVLSLLDGTQQAQLQALVAQDKAQYDLAHHIDTTTAKQQAQTKAVNDQITAYSKLSGLMGGVDAIGIINGTAGKSGTWPYSPSGQSTPGSYDLQKQITAASNAVQHWANIVYTDGKTHSDSLKADEAELAKHKAQLVALQKTESDLTGTSAKASTSTDTLTKLTDQRSKLEVQVQADIHAGIKPSSDLTGHITSLSGEITKIQGVISGLENPVKARLAAEKAAELQTGSWTKSLAAAQAAATKAQNEYLYDKDVLHLHGQALHDAYEKMLKANTALAQLQKDATDAGNALMKHSAAPSAGVPGSLFLAKQIENASHEHLPKLIDPTVDFATKVSNAQAKVTQASDLVTQKLYDLHHGIEDTLPPLSTLEARYGTAETKLKAMESAAHDAGVALGTIVQYAKPSGFTGLPSGALGNGSLGGQAGGGGYTVGGNTIRIPTSSQIANLPQNQVSGTITAPGVIPVSVVSMPSLANTGGIQSLLGGTPTQFGQPTTVELKALQQLQSVMSAGNAVDSAKLTVLADTSKMNVDATNATTNAVQDQTSVLQAQAAVGTARSNATIAAINDETAVMSAQGQYAIDSLKSSQTIAADLKKYGPGAQVGLDVHLAAAIAKVDQDNIAIAKAKETQDRALGQLSIKISEDGLKAAQDKAKADEVAAKFTQLTDKDRIAVDTANLHIAQDNQQIMLAQLGQLVTLNKGQDDFTNLIAQAGSDNTAAGLATWQLGGDQSASDASAALYGGLMAGDAQQTALDQNDYATTQGAGDTQLAYLNQTQSQDSTQVSLLQQAVSGISQVASNTSSSGSIVDALKTAFDAIAAMTQTGGIGGNGGQALTFNDMLNAVGAAVAVGLGQSLGSVAITRNP